MEETVMVFLSRRELEFVKNLVIENLAANEERIKLAAKLIEACEREDTKHTSQEPESVQSDSEALMQA